MTFHSHIRCRAFIANTLLFALVLPAPASPLQWEVGRPGVTLIGRCDVEEPYWLYTADIQNYGTTSGDNMVSESLKSVAGDPLHVFAVFASGNEITWTPTVDGGVTFEYFVAAGMNFTLEVVLFAGSRDPGRLRLSAMAGNGGGDPIPFNDLIIGPPYAQPSLALARQAPPGPGTNAVALAISSDAEFLQLQCRDTLSPTNWTDLARVAVTGAVTVATDTNAVPTRFYRAVSP